MRLDGIPFDLALRCVAMLPIAEGPKYRTISHRFRALGGGELSRCRASLGVRELRLMGAVGADPRRCKRQVAAAGNSLETARVSFALQPQSASAAKNLLQIKGPELVAVLEGVDRAASSLEIPDSSEHVDTIKETGKVTDQRSVLHDWDSGGVMSDAEAYAVLGGQLYMIGPPRLRSQRWMMRVEGDDERFAGLQNARLYVADVDAELLPAESPPGNSDSTLCEQRFAKQGCPTVAPSGGSTATAEGRADGTPQGIRGKLFFCALEM